MPRRETFVQSGDWIKFRDENHWRYAPPYDPRNDARPKRLAPPTNLSNRRGNRGASGRSKAPVLNMNSNGDFQVMKYGKGKSLPGYSGLPVVDTRIKMPSRSQMIKALAHLGFSVATKFNPYAQIAYTAADVAYTFYENGWFDNMFSGGSWSIWKEEPAFQGGVKESDITALGFSLCWTCPDTVGSQDRLQPYGYNGDGSCPRQFCTLQYGDDAFYPAGSVAVEASVSSLLTWTTETLPPPYYARWYNRSMYARDATGGAPAGFVRVLPPSPAYSIVAPTLTISPPVPVSSESSYNDPVRRQALKRYELPAVEVSSDGGKSPPRITTHVRSKPGRGEREKKGQIDRRLAQRVVAALYDATTEASDFVDIAYDALKKGHKCRGAKSMSDKAWCVYQNIEHIDVTELAYGLVYNHLEDKYIGSIFGKVGKKTKYGTLMYGGYIPSPF